MRTLCSRPAGALRRRLGNLHGSDGFVLLESLVSITLIAIVMAAFGTFLTKATATTSHERAEQGASQIADSAVEYLRSMHASDLTPGHDVASVTAQFAAANATVQPWLATMDPATDATAATGSGATATIPTVPKVQTANHIAYSTGYYLGWCGIPADGSTGCGLAAEFSGIRYLRAVIAITWSDSQCKPGCAYVTATLVNTADDLTFNLNQVPPPLPATVNPGSQTAVVGDSVSLQLAVKDGTGVPTFTWQITAGGLPAGLSMTPSGLITGTPMAAIATLSVTVTVTDAFLHTDTVTFSWKILPLLTAANPADQAATTGTAITALLVSATGGSGSPYTWSDPNGTLPPGLTLATVSNQGRITGTPTTVGIYSVRLTVTDAASAHSTTISFTWTINYPALVATNPGAQISTVSTAITALQLSGTGGSGSYSWSGAASLPTGLAMTAAGKITGTPSATGTWPVALTLTDNVTGTTRPVAFNWTINYPALAAANPGAQVSTVSTAITALQLAGSGGSGSYSWSGAASLPTGLAMTTGGKITGSPSVIGTWAVTLTLTDTVTGTTRPVAFSWAVVAKPTVTSPGNQVVTVGAAIDFFLATSCPNAPCTYTINNGPGTLAISASGEVTGTITSTPQTFAAVSFSVGDAAGASATTSAFTVTINAAPTITGPGNQTTYKGTAVTLALAPLVTGGTGGYAYAASGLPSWLTLNTTTGVITGTAPATTQIPKTGITVQVTDSLGVSVTSAPFKWFVTDLKTTMGNQTTYPAVTVSLDLDTFTTGGTAPYTYTASGLPSWLTLTGSTGVLTGKAPSTIASTPNITVSVTDSTGAVITSARFTWFVSDLKWSTIPSQTSTHNVADSLNVTPYDTGGTSPYTYSAAGLPTGLTMNATTGLINGKPTTAGTYTVKVTSTDSLGASVTSAAFTWTVS